MFRKHRPELDTSRMRPTPLGIRHNPRYTPPFSASAGTLASTKAQRSV